MPYGYKSKKDFFEKTKKRRWNDFVADCKVRFGVKRYFHENRDGSYSIETGLNRVHVRAMQAIGDPGHDLAILNASDTYKTTALGANPLTDDMTVNGSTKIGRHLIYDEVTIHHLRNVTTHSAIVRCYECVARNDIASTDAAYNTSAEMVLSDFIEGLDALTATGTAYTTASTTLVGGALHGIDSWNQGHLFSQFLTPNMSPRFRQNWKIIKKLETKFEPGDDLYWRMEANDHIYDPERDLSNNGNNKQDARIIRGGLTKILLVLAHGCLGAVTGDETAIGLMNVHLAGDLVHKAKVLPINLVEPDHHQKLEIDAETSIAALVGPTDEVEAADKAG